MNAVISTTSSSSSPTQGLLSSTVNASMVHQPNVVATTAGGATVITSNSLGLHDDVIRSPPSTPESEQFDDSDLLTNAAVANDEVTQRLMVAGTVGLAAAAAIATGMFSLQGHKEIIHGVSSYCVNSKLTNCSSRESWVTAC